MILIVFRESFDEKDQENVRNTARREENIIRPGLTTVVLKYIVYGSIDVGPNRNEKFFPHGQTAEIAIKKSSLRTRLRSPIQY